MGKSVGCSLGRLVEFVLAFVGCSWVYGLLGRFVGGSELLD